MPKNPHPPRAGAKNPPEASGASIGTNGTNANKKGKKVDNESKQDSKSKGKNKESVKDSQASQDTPKKPDTRTLIGGPSWTGKLPVNMWSEQTQKRKWDKPDYTMTTISEGFISSVVLRSTNPKTQEKTQLPIFEIPRQFRASLAEPTTVEARHCAAALTLFRVCNKTSLYMMMPPKYRDLWKGAFQEIKADDEAHGRTWIYQPDPFIAFKEKEDSMAVAIKRREEIEKQKAREEVQPGLSSARGKDWSRAPKVDMSKRMRRYVERLVRQNAIWNPHSVAISKAINEMVIEEVVQVGFRRAHVQEAAEICKDKEEILEWLLIHVPEDDLPKWSLPENYKAGVSMASGDLKREACLKRLAAAGYS